MARTKYFQKSYSKGYPWVFEIYAAIERKARDYFFRIHVLWFMSVLWLGNCNWLQGRGVEVSFSIHSWQFGFGVAKPWYRYRDSFFRKRWSGSSIEPYHTLVLCAGWSGIQFGIPRFIQKWMSERDMRRFEEAYSNAPDMPEYYMEEGEDNV